MRFVVSLNKTCIIMKKNEKGDDFASALRTILENVLRETSQRSQSPSLPLQRDGGHRRELTLVDITLQSAIDQEETLDTLRSNTTDRPGIWSSGSLLPSPSYQIHLQEASLDAENISFQDALNLSRSNRQRLLQVIDAALDLMDWTTIFLTIGFIILSYLSVD